MPNIDKINYKGTEYDLTPADYDSKANVDGYYETFTSGQTEQIIATEAITDTEPYNYRKTGGPNDVGDRVYDTLVGGSVVWNQLVKDGNFTSASNWKGGGTYGACSATFTDNVATITINDNTQTSARANLQPQTISEPILNHKYFVTVDCNPSKALPPNNLAVLYGGVFFLSSVEANVWNKMSKIVNAENVVHNSGTLYTQSYVTYFSNGDTLKYRNYNIIDLTAALGSTIADYVYSLETATAGAGVAWFRKYFPGIYYGYCEPHFEHVQTSAKVTVGFNQWDEETANGYWDKDTGAFVSSNNWKASKNYIPCLPNTAYYFKATVPGSGSFGNVVFYDSDKGHISYQGSTVVNNTFTTPNNCHYMTFYADSRYFANDICINLHGDRDGEYEAYRKRTYPIEPKVLRGISKLDSANRLYFDGDIYRHDGSGEQRYFEADLGTLNWTIYSADRRIYRATVANLKTFYASQIANIMTPNYKTVSGSANWQNGDIATTSSSPGYVFICDTAYADAASFKTAMSGQMLVYEANTPEPFTAEPFQSPMVVDPFGTEEFVDYGVTEGDRDVAIPVGHSSEYPADLRGKLQHLPSLASADGRYCVQQSGKQMSLVADTSPGRLNVLENKIPDPPTTEGNYQLTCSINSIGSPAFSWVAVASE